MVDARNPALPVWLAETSHAPEYSRFVDLRTYAYAFIILALLLADFVPRFFQGDSVSYLMTGHNGWIPPDRSWCFGFIVNFLLRHSHGYSALILIQTTALGCIIGLMRLFFLDFASWQMTYAVVTAVACLDPVLEIYTRFFMTDFLSFVCFMIFMLGTHTIINPVSQRREIGLWLFVALFAAISAVFLRVAYALIIELTVLLIGLFWLRRLSARRWMGLAVAAGIPFLAVGLLVAANIIVFAQRFPHETFVLKLSGISLAAVFAPALQVADFEYAGIPVTGAEFQRLDLGNYDKRGRQLWGKSANDLQQFLRDKLNIQDDYTAAVDRTATRLVESAFLRDPLSLAVVYARSASYYFIPSKWKRAAYGEMGLSSPLPDDFVTFFNAYSVPKIVPAITQVKSPIIRVYEILSYLYPIQLALGLCAALILLLREPARPCVIVLSAGFFADLATAPLYSNYMIPRYILAGIFISYLLIGLAGLSLMQRRTRKSDQHERWLGGRIAR